jgi:hypothetical protein
VQRTAILLEQIIHLVDFGGYIGNFGAREVFEKGLFKLLDDKYL